jgi:hypothetical protein
MDPSTWACQHYKASQTLLYQQALNAVKVAIEETLYPYQRDWLNPVIVDRHIISTRQQGKARIIALTCVYAALEANYDTDVVVVTQSHDHSKDAISDAARWVDTISQINSKLFDATVRSQEIVFLRSDGITTRIIAKVA